MMSSKRDEAGQFSVEDNLKNLSAGAVLLSRDALKDPNFDTTVVLVCVHGTEGAYGLVLNRPSHMPLSEIFDGFTGLKTRREIYIGGPVQQEELQIVQLTAAPVEEAFSISPNVYLGGKWESISQMIDADTATTRLFLGYSGWAPEQLESEIQAGAWDVYRVNLEQLLQNIHKLVGVDTDTISRILTELPR